VVKLLPDVESHTERARTRAKRLQLKNLSEDWGEDLRSSVELAVCSVNCAQPMLVQPSATDRKSLVDNPRTKMRVTWDDPIP
jgi:hypothetical protein